MVNEEIVGTEVDYNWTFDSEGDLALVYGGDNLRQAVFLRLSAYFDSLNWCYDFYGSYVKDWLGKNQNAYTRTTLTEEIKKRVMNDPRINEAEVELEDWTANGIGVQITADVMDGTSFQEYYIFSDLPRKNENVNSPNWSNTWIDTNENGYYGKQGEYITVHCYVRDKEYRRVPIGEVSLSIGGYNVDIEENPQMVRQSDSNDPGGCTFTFRIPRSIKQGTHDLTFRYKGIRGYNNCSGTTKLHVVHRIPTTMEFIYPKKNENWYYANDHDVFTEPVVHVTDANTYDVLHGQVRYYISNYSEDDFVFIEFPIIFNGSTLLQKTVYMYCSSKILDYSLKFIFQLGHMFRPTEIIRLVAGDGTVIDYLDVGFNNGATYWDGKKWIGRDKYNEGVFFLTSTKYTKPYEYTYSTGKRMDVKRNDDIDTLRTNNTYTSMKVIE